MKHEICRAPPLRTISFVFFSNPMSTPSADTIATDSNAQLAKAWSGLARWVVVGVASVYVMAIARDILKFGFGHDHMLGFGQRLSAGDEGTLPAWISASVLLMCGLLLFMIARLTKDRGGSFVTQWYVLAFGFAFLSADETVRFHEMLAPFGRKLTGMPHGWAVFGIAGAVIAGLYFFRFLLHLPRRVAVLFVIAGVCYVGGGGGVELLQGLYERFVQRRGAGVSAIMMVEEIMEAGGATLFLHTLCGYVASQLLPSSARVRPRAEASSARQAVAAG
jgi:hypothetical protein